MDSVGRTARSTKARVILTPQAQAHVPWTVTTVSWSAIAALLPVNYALPSAAKAMWFAAIAAIICIPLLLQRVAQPLYPAVWIFAGYASFASILLATNESTITDNLFVGAQLILILGCGVFCLTHAALADQRFAHRLATAFLLGQSLSAGAAILQLMGYSIFMPQNHWWDRRVQGLADHPNTLGLMSALAIVIALQVAFSSRKYLALALVGVIVNILGLIGSGSLTGILALSAGLFVLALCMRSHLGKITIWGASIAILFWLVAILTNVFDILPSLSHRYNQVTGQNASGSSLENRGQTYAFAWSKISEDPLFGFGLNGRTSGTYNGVTMVHNAFLRAWYQGGILLAVAFALIIVALIVVVIRATVTRKYASEAAVIAVIVVYASVSPVLEQRQFWLPVLVAWASISAATAHQVRLTKTFCPNSRPHPSSVDVKFGEILARSGNASTDT